jgi:hypothetical protein
MPFQGIKLLERLFQDVYSSLSAQHHVFAEFISADIFEVFNNATRITGKRYASTIEIILTLNHHVQQAYSQSCITYKQYTLLNSKAVVIMKLLVTNGLAELSRDEVKNVLREMKRPTIDQPPSLRQSDEILAIVPTLVQASSVSTEAPTVLDFDRVSETVSTVSDSNNMESAALEIVTIPLVGTSEQPSLTSSPEIVSTVSAEESATIPTVVTPLRKPKLRKHKCRLSNAAKRGILVRHHSVTMWPYSHALHHYVRSSDVTKLYHNMIQELRERVESYPTFISHLHHHVAHDVCQRMRQTIAQYELSEFAHHATLISLLYCSHASKQVCAQCILQRLSTVASEAPSRAPD